MPDWIHKIDFREMKSRSPAEVPPPTDDWWKNPDMSAVQGVEKKYWKAGASGPVEMSQREKDEVDEAVARAEEAAEIATIDDGGMRRLVLVLVDEINVIRKKALMKPITVDDIKAAMRAK